MSCLLEVKEKLKPVQKTNLMGMPIAKVENFFAEFGEERFRASQTLQWIHQKGILDFESMTNFSKSLRRKLTSIAEVRPPDIVNCEESTDGTRKWLIQLNGGNCVEAVFIPERGRGTLCVSSQIGCALDCSFCATGKQGFNRDLSASEIIGQVWLASKSLGKFDQIASKCITNIVMMGMGEPLMNFDNVVDAMNLMLDDHGYGLSKRRVTLSTAGVIPAIEKLGNVSDVSLAISLHAPNDKLRNKLVPINRKYPLSGLVSSAKRYLDKMPDNRRKITIEYTLMDKVNDRSHHARELADLLKELPCKINLIPFNPFHGAQYKRVTDFAMYRFRDILQQHGYTVTIRTTRGDDIAAACGQLAGQVNDKTRRQERYKQKLGEEQPVKMLM